MAVTINDVVKTADSNTYDFDYKCLSTDTKPTDDVEENSLLLEMDTAIFYYFHSGSWYVLGTSGE